ncbi:MAG: hypothetical protein ACI8S6_001210 [Myxococcota bacterium]|jgi:hypothetical protein
MATTTPPTRSSSLLVWLEVHFDDEVLSADPRQWPQARALLRRLARVAEDTGARLSLRFRHTFARHAADSDLLPELARRGHEIGAHAHGRRLSAAIEALQACGLSPTVAAPGLVQAGLGGRALLLRQAAAQGITLVTDHSAQRAWAYEGLLPRTEQGVQVAAPTVRPFDWGLMTIDGTRHGLTAESITMLRQREAQAVALGAAWFGLTLHEHDLCAPGTLTLRPSALDALASYLDGRVVTSRKATSTGAPPPLAVAARPPSDRRIQLSRAVFAVTHRAHRALSRAPRPRIPLRQPRPDRIAVGGRELAVARHGPQHPRAILVLCHAGREGGRRLGLRPFGVSLSELTGRGWAVWLYDRSGTGDSPPGPAPTGWRRAHPLAPGNPAHTRDWTAVLAAARQESAPLVALSWSSGVVPVLRAAAAGERPDALVDAEAPADRWSLVPPRPSELAALDPWDETVWVGLEPQVLLAALQRPYARLQAEQDHVHGRMHHHSERMVAVAEASGQPTRPPALLAGRLHAHPDHTVRVLEWAAEAALSQRR